MNQHTGRPQTLKLLNQSNIETVIRNHGPITKPQIAQITKLSLVTVNKTVDALLEQRIVRCLGLDKPGKGRAANSYEINKELSYMICLYYEKQQYWGVLANLTGEIIYEEEFPVNNSCINEDTNRCIDHLILQAENHKISAIGLGIPGVVRKNRITNIPQIPFWEGYYLGKELEQKYNCPVFIENDINLAASGLYSSQDQTEIKHLALLYLDQGIGSGFIIDGELFKGFSCFAGEIGSLGIPVNHNFDQTINFEQEISAVRDLLKKADQKDSKSQLREQLYLIVAQITGMIACIINPEILAIQCDLLTEEELIHIHKKIKLSTQDCPKLILVKEFRKHCINGVLNMCMLNTRTVLTLLNK